MKGSLLEFKVVVLGDQGVGKSALVLRFIQGHFNAQGKSTVGAHFLTKKINLPNDKSFKMQLWDTAGQERFRAMAPMYYRNAAVAIICFDITNEESFNKMKDWMDELTAHNRQDGIILTIACNKIDMEGSRVVSRIRAEEYATKMNALLFETSAKENIGVEDMFKKISDEIVEKKYLIAALAAESSNSKQRSSFTRLSFRSKMYDSSDQSQSEYAEKGCC